jgi:hypothetical protein
VRTMAPTIAWQGYNPPKRRKFGNFRNNRAGAGQ